MPTFRIFGDQIHYHVIARCNNAEPLLNEPEDCRRVLEFLKFYADRHTCKVYTHGIMPTHIHLMLMTDNGNRLDQIMHDFCLAVAKDYNLRHKRAGHFWRHRYRSKIIHNDRHALACLRYIHRNAVDAGLVQRPKDWLWSSYHFYAYGKPDEIVEAHPSYYLLGGTAEERQQAWRDIAGTESKYPKAEQAIFEGKLREGSTRFVSAWNQAYRPLMKYLTGRCRKPPSSR